MLSALWRPVADIESRPSLENWHVIFTKPRQERIALENLQRQDYECFLPLIQSEKDHRGRVTMTSEALFPRYLFVKLSADVKSKSWSPIRSTVGVSHLVCFGRTYAKVDNELVESLRTRSDNPQRRRFSPGDSILINDGALTGLEAIYQCPSGEGRAMLLLTILSRSVEVEVNTSIIRKVH